MTPPLQLGDSTRAFKTLLAYPDSRNNFVTFTMRWTHGPVVLQARIGANASKNQQISDLIPWAEQVEQQYQASALPAASLRLAALAPAPGARLAPGVSPLVAVLPNPHERPRRSARKVRAAALAAA